jgi:hypothetical protein
MFGNLVVWISAGLAVRAGESERGLVRFPLADAAGFLKIRSPVT